MRKGTMNAGDQKLKMKDKQTKTMHQTNTNF